MKKLLLAVTLLFTSNLIQAQTDKEILMARIQMALDATKAKDNATACKILWLSQNNPYALSNPKILADIKEAGRRACKDAGIDGLLF
ncbi:hypothetical protein [Polynucleobacter sp. UB-Piko-W3]|uniref:hypothetical protein n=1 Tax=Polynucleobacter sp. UB-Piko-W3 TaxID=1819735 RepID=UPI001C0E11A9|nr:hypothetical protein [Polynucleobacter sp. UB-Piko-W3]MBU3554734.1 hypothetical protein [Polynucleobacter sp. UB-Piko-W3]